MPRKRTGQYFICEVCGATFYRCQSTIERGPQTKLTWEAVGRIRSLHATGKYDYHALAAMFDVSRGQIYAVVTYRAWQPST